MNGLALGPGEREMGPKNGGPINLNSALLRGASLRAARLLAADLDRADLSNADLSHGRLNQANLGAANLSAARLNHADLTGAALRKAKLKGASLRSANLTEADLRSADLSNADLRHARLQGTNLSAANLSQANCDYADFVDTKLKGANLAGASLYHAKNITRAQLEEAKWDSSTVLPPHLAGATAGAPAKAPVKTPTKEKPKNAVSRARAKPKAPARVASPARAASAGAKPRRIYSSLRSLGRRASWLTAAALWTFVVIGFAMKQSSEAVPLLPPVMPAVPELGLTAAYPGPNATASDATRDRRGLENAAASPLIFVSLGRPQDAILPAPTLLDEPSDSAPPVASGLPVSPLRQIGPDIAEDIRPDMLPATASALADLRLASLKQTRLRPVTRSPGTVRLRDAPDDTPLAEEPATGPLTLIVSLRHQKLDVYRGARLIETTAISSGMKGHETQPGVFSILEKRRYHESNIYSNAPMPWMQRLTRSGTALHGGVVPGYPASHGCIRLPAAFAPKLFEMTERGMNVIVADDRIAPARIDHPNLPQPLSDVADLSRRQASLEVKNDAVVADASSAPPLRILVTRRTLRDRIISVQTALAEMGYLAEQNFTGIIGPKTRAALRAFQKANDLPQTGALSKDLAAAIYKAAGKDEPPQGHLFMRQGNRSLFDEPVAFSDPDRSLGTHVFTSMAPAPGENSTIWLGMSLEGGSTSDALDRLQIPADLRRKLAASLSPGSTFIIGDISLDTAILPDGDDFIVVTKDVPSAVAAIPQETKQAARKATVSKQVKRAPQRATREARRRSFDSGPRTFPRGLFSRW